MEWKIGEIFEYNGEWYQCLPERCICNDCAFKNDITCKTSKEIRGECQRASRQDGVIFKKLKKVGEPYILENKKFQKYIVSHTPYIYNKVDCSWQSFADPYYISLEIKQNQEDMEEKKIKLNQDDLTYIIGKIRCDILPKYTTYDEITEEITKLFTPTNGAIVSNSETIEKNLKPFSLEAAKLGKPVCTRDGHKARILCFDLKNEEEYPIVAAIENDSHEILLCYTLNGEIVRGAYEANKDLIMPPEKKEGWMNVYKYQIHDTPESAKESLCKGITDYIKTIRVEWEE